MVFPPGLLLLFEPVLLQACQRGHPRVRGMAFTAAFLVIQIHSALGTKTAAIAAADGLHRQGQEDLLGQNIGEKHPFALEERDFGIVELQAFFLFLGHGSERLVKQVKLAADIFVNGFQAPGAHQLQPGMKLPGNPNLTFHKLGRRPDFERLDLPEVTGTVIHRSGSVALPDAKLADRQLFDV